MLLSSTNMFENSVLRKKVLFFRYIFTLWRIQWKRAMCNETIIIICWSSTFPFHILHKFTSVNVPSVYKFNLFFCTVFTKRILNILKGQRQLYSLLYTFLWKSSCVFSFSLPVKEIKYAKTIVELVNTKIHLYFIYLTLHFVFHEGR